MSTGQTWLGIAISPIAAATAEIASSSGTPAATSEPNVMTRMSSVSGNDSNSALPRSLAKMSLSSCWVLTVPNCSTV